MTIKKHRTLISLVIISLMILLGFNPAINNSQKGNVNTSLFNKNPLTSEIGSLSFRNSPFFNHSESDFSFYDQLSQEYSPEFSITMRSLNTSGGVHVEDTNFYSGDQFLYLMGMGQKIIEDQLDLFEHYINIKNSLFWDDIGEGFYNKIDENFQLLDEEKFVYDNLLALNFLKDIQSIESQTEMEDIWNSILDNFWNASRGAFMHSNDDDNYEFISDDNFLAASLLFEVTKNFGGVIGAEMLNYGDNIMSLFNNSLYDSNNPSYYSYLDLVDDNHNQTTNKYLLSNALGLSALLNWYITTDFNHADPKTSLEVDQAIKIWDFLNDTFYNDINDMYMSSSNEDGSVILDSQMYLYENAWMLISTLDLFKITGNLTYYTAALKHFYGIEDNLYDGLNNGYGSSTNINDQDIKSVDGYNILLIGLYDFYEIYESSNLFVNVNQSEYIYLTDSQFNASSQLSISMDFNFNSTIGVQWGINAAIPNATINYTLRYMNDTIIEEQFNSKTNSDGEDEYLFNYPVEIGVDTFKLSSSSSITGFKDAYNNAELQIVPGITIDSYFFESDSNFVSQGETTQLNVSFNSIRSDNLTIDVKNGGDNIEEALSDPIKIINNSVTTALINITAKEDSITGNQDLIFKLYNNSTLLTSKTFIINIESSVKIGIFTFDRLLDFQPLQISIPITNLSAASSESLQLTISSPYFEEINKTINSIPYMETVEEIVLLVPNDDAFFGFLEFTVNFTRYGTTYYSEAFYIESVPEIQILGFDHSTNIIQGQKPVVSLDILNYNISSQNIIVKSNGVVVSEFNANYGSSKWNIAIDSVKNNPYDVSQKQYYVEILDSDGEILATKIVIINIQPSVMNIFLFYILPILIPIGIILFFKNKDIEFDIRNK